MVADGARHWPKAAQPEVPLMPAQIVPVHDATVRALMAAGHEVRAFPDPLVALDALASARRMELLITRAKFPAGRSNGAALALVARNKRPGVKVLFVCRPDFWKGVEKLKEVLAAPAMVSELVKVATRLLRTVSVDANNSTYPTAATRVRACARRGPVTTSWAQASASQTKLT